MNILSLGGEHKRHNSFSKNNLTLEIRTRNYDCSLELNHIELILLSILPLELFSNLIMRIGPFDARQ